MRDFTIAVMSCGPNKHKRDAIRRTWMTDMPADVPVMFFVGDTDSDDAIRLSCPDDYDHCWLKQMEMIRHLWERSHVFFCDDDTYVVASRLMACGYDQHRYMGCPCEIEGGVTMAHGGAGFFLNRTAMKAINRISPKHDVFKSTTFSDRIVGKLMKIVGIKLFPDFRFNPGKYKDDKGFCNLVPNQSNRYVTTHFVTPQLMELLDHHFKNGGPTPRNIYDMYFGGKRVLVYESEGDWNYLIEGTGQAVGGFKLAHFAEAEAFSRLGKS